MIYTLNRLQMNKLADKAQTHGLIPTTPNLESYKLHGKNKPKRKQPPPTNQPTLQPSIKSPNLAFCSLHPDKVAVRCLEKNPKKKFCTTCAITYGGNDFLDEERNFLVTQKRRRDSKYKCSRRRWHSCGTTWTTESTSLSAQ